MDVLPDTERFSVIAGVLIKLEYNTRNSAPAKNVDSSFSDLFHDTCQMK